MKSLRLALVALIGTITIGLVAVGISKDARCQDPESMNPSADGGYDGGYIVSQPGAMPYQPPTYVNPTGNGGYIATQPGAMPYQPPTFVNPTGDGGYMVTQPGAVPYEPPIYINPQR